MKRVGLQGDQSLIVADLRNLESGTYQPRELLPDSDSGDYMPA